MLKSTVKLGDMREITWHYWYSGFVTSLETCRVYSKPYKEWSRETIGTFSSICDNHKTNPKAGLPIKFTNHIPAWSKQIYQCVAQDGVLPEEAMTILKNHIDDGCGFIKEMMSKLNPLMRHNSCAVCSQALAQEGTFDEYWNELSFYLDIGISLLDIEWDLGYTDYQDMVIADSVHPKELDDVVEKERHDKTNLNYKQRYTAINFVATLSSRVHKSRLEAVDHPKKIKSLLCKKKKTFKNKVPCLPEEVLITHQQILYNMNGKR